LFDRLGTPVGRGQLAGDPIPFLALQPMDPLEGG
jgi:hypothetical protein